MDTITLWDVKYYMIERLRWADLNKISGYKTSGQVLKYKQVPTAIGTVEVPIEDITKFQDLSKEQLASVLNTVHQFDGEEDTALAMELMEEGETADALEILNNVQDRIRLEMGETHVLYANVLADIGWVYYNMGEYDTALQYYENATVVDEKFVEQYDAQNMAASANMLVLTMIKAGFDNVVAKSTIMEQAFHALAKAENADRIKILMNLSNIYQNANMPVRSIALLKLARHVLPKGTEMVYDVNLFLGIGYFMREDYDTSKRILNIAKLGYEKLGLSKTHTNYVETLYFLANVELKLHNYELCFKLLSDIKDMVEVYFENPPSANALLVCTMAEALLGMGQNEKAIMFFEAAETIITNDPKLITSLTHLRIQLHLAEALESSGATDRLLPHYEQVVATGTLLLGEKHEVVEKYQGLLEKLK